MKSVLIFRHGKSNWDAPYETDHERPLAKRGRRAAGLMGRFLRHIDQLPDLVSSSTAVRARQTAELAMEAGQWGCPLECTRTLYEANAVSVLELLQAQSDSLTNVLLVGHQPTWSELVARLTGGSTVRLPTAALARIDFTASRWRQVDFGDGTLIWLVTPKLLAKAGF